MSGRYDEIIHLPHHVSTVHPQMPLADRAAQFSPFAALTGYDAAVAEAGRLTCRRAELTESETETLNHRLTLLQEHLAEGPAVSITYFQPDERKDGGAYVRVSGVVKKVDAYQRTVVFTDKTAIPIDEIARLEGELFPRLGLDE